MKIKNRLKIYNPLTQRKEFFKSIIPNYVGMYVCGPTVYKKIHLGNCRTFLFFDIVFRYLKHLGYNVRYIRNITDVGHLEYEFGEYGEDKILKKALIERIEPMELAHKYIYNFHFVLNLFNTLSPSIEPLASGHIIEQIEIIKKLLKIGLAYEFEGSVFFDLKLYNNYGILSKINIKNLLSNKSINKNKKNHFDFTLWKKAYKEHVMQWPSPWGIGFPGWHIECSAMSNKYLGKKFDIHGGGLDLKFPHHECEIAQNKAVFGIEPVNYWMYTNMLTLNGKKMSKSKNIIIYPEDIFNGVNPLLKKAFKPTVVRFFMFQTHYRSLIDIRYDNLIAAEQAYYKLISSFEYLNYVPIHEYSSLNIESWIIKCYNALNDDFNTPALISNLFEVVRWIKDLCKKKETINLTDINLLKLNMSIFLFEILGLENILIKNYGNYKMHYVSLITEILKLRNYARKNKNWDYSDRIRNILTKFCIKMHDYKNYKTTFNLPSTLQKSYI